MILFLQVLWEAFSYQIAGAGLLPSMYDLLFVGDVSPSVSEVTSQKRTGTGSMAFVFEGCPGQSQCLLLCTGFSLHSCY